MSDVENLLATYTSDIEEKIKRLVEARETFLEIYRARYVQKTGYGGKLMVMKAEDEEICWIEKNTEMLLPKEYIDLTYITNTASQWGKICGLPVEEVELVVESPKLDRDRLKEGILGRVYFRRKTEKVLG